MIILLPALRLKSVRNCDRLQSAKGESLAKRCVHRLKDLNVNLEVTRYIVVLFCLDSNLG